MKKIISTLLGLLFVSLSFAGQIDRIDPPNWWTGFENSNLQLMVYGENISALTPEINYEGVEIYSVTRAQSPNYLFVDLRLAENVKPGSCDILFKDAKKVVSKYRYVLNQRA